MERRALMKSVALGAKATALAAPGQPARSASNPAQRAETGPFIDRMTDDSFRQWTRFVIYTICTIYLARSLWLRGLRC